MERLKWILLKDAKKESHMWMPAAEMETDIWFTTQVLLCAICLAELVTIYDPWGCNCEFWGIECKGHA